MENNDKLDLGARRMVRTPLPQAISEKLPKPLYITRYGAAYVGDALQLLKMLPNESIDLVITSPPFPLQRMKRYGRPAEEFEFVEWILPFTSDVYRVLKENGSFVIDLGGVYKKGRPVRSLYNYRLLIELCDKQDWRLAEEFFWFNPSKLPSPIEWVNKRKIRVKDSVNTIWWITKTDFPKVYLSNVLIKYSERMKALLKLRERFYKPKERPSGHEISDKFMFLDIEKGAIPPNLLVIPNTDSSSLFIKACRIVNTDLNPARFPEELPEFFIRFLTEPGDVVLDIFAGSNATGAAAEKLGRYWIAFEINREYLASSAFRFISRFEESIFTKLFNKLMTSEETINLEETNTLDNYYR
jgi:site-specific DNA-methyltransferase (cytosine-N4-specific)